MCFLRAKPIGLMPMLDQGEQDDKVHLITRSLCCTARVSYAMCGSRPLSSESCESTFLQS